MSGVEITPDILHPEGWIIIKGVGIMRLNKGYGIK
jgi:hypothetical protein